MVPERPRSYPSTFAKWQFIGVFCDEVLSR